MKRVRNAGLSFLAAAGLALLVVFEAVGCGGGVGVDYVHSGNNPVIAYRRTQALAPQYSFTGPDLIIYGDGTAYRREGQMRYWRGSLPEEELTRLLTSIVDGGFFDLKEAGKVGPMGGPVDHLTVTLKSQSKQVSEGTAVESGAFKKIVDELKGLKVPGEQEYIPEDIVLHARLMEGGATSGGRVQEWTLDPAWLEKASAAGSPGEHLSGTQAQEVWKVLAGENRADGEVFWNAGGKVYGQVIADPQFPMPGV